MFVVVLALRYKKVYLKKSFDIFCECFDKLRYQGDKELWRRSGDHPIPEGPQVFFYYNNNTKDLTTEEARSELNKAILAARVRHYIKQEARLASNMNRVYSIIWGRCTPGLQSVMKGNGDYNKNSKTFYSLRLIK